MKCEKRRAVRYANVALALYEMRVRTVKRTFRRSMPSCLAYGSLSEACVPFGIWGLVEKVGPVRHTEARRKVWCKGTCRKVRPVWRMGPLGPLGKCALLGVWKPVEGMHSLRRWQKTPQWGPFAWIWERAARKRHDGAFSRADILRLSFRKIT